MLPFLQGSLEPDPYRHALRACTISASARGGKCIASSSPSAATALSRRIHSRLCCDAVRAGRDPPGSRAFALLSCLCKIVTCDENTQLHLAHDGAAAARVGAMTVVAARAAQGTGTAAKHHESCQSYMCKLPETGAFMGWPKL